MRDMEAINSVYMPSAHKSFVYLRIGSAGYVVTLRVMITPCHHIRHTV